MVVELKEDIFSNTDFKSINYIIQMLTYKQRYQLFVEWSHIKDTELYQRLDEDDKKEIEESYNDIIQSGLDTNYFISESNHNSYFSIEEAIRFFIQPVSIILENSLNDQYFIMAIIKHFDDTREVARHLKNGWIQFENAGGCTNVENFLKSKLQSFNNLAIKYAKPNHTYLRCFVLLDSDKEYSTQPSKHSSLSIFLTTQNVNFHILGKRYMESYMPDAVYDYITNPDLQTWINAHKHLSSIQKDYLNIHEGFPKKLANGDDRRYRTELDINIQNLYANVSDTNFDILGKGFKYPNFKANFPKLFETSHQVHKKSLSERAGSNELQEILNKIVGLL